MKPGIILRLRALGIALDRINLTTDLGALEEIITSEILMLDELAQQNEILSKAYKEVRLDLLTEVLREAGVLDTSAYRQPEHDKRDKDAWAYIESNYCG
jgi:hypothetical protein